MYEGKDYITYVDKRSLAGNTYDPGKHVVGGWFKRVYTPVGSHRLGIENAEKFKPNVVTHSIYRVAYHDSIYRTDFFKCYDVHNNLIYDGIVRDDNIAPSGGHYVPESEHEIIRDKLFHSYGWE